MALLRGQPWFAIVVDLGLPDRPGWDVLVAARDAGHEGALLIATGKTPDRSDLNRALELGAAFACKPLLPSGLRTFALEVAPRQVPRARRVENALAEWQRTYRLTPTEFAILEEAVAGTSQRDLAGKRHIAHATVKKHVQNVLMKTGDESLASAVARLLRAAV